MSKLADIFAPILSQRKAEIEEGKNLGTRYPIYIVMDTVEAVISGHDLDIKMPYPNHRGIPNREIWVNDEHDELEYCDLEEEEGEPFTLVCYDFSIAYFLTRAGAERYLESQRHNLDNPFVYVDDIGYRNGELEPVFKEIDDCD